MPSPGPANEVRSWRVAALVLVAAAIAVVAGCNSGGEAASREAITKLRMSAEAVREYGQHVLVSSASPDEAFRRLREHERFVDGRVDGDAISWDVVLVERGIETGWMTYDDASLRACLRYTGRVGSTADVRWADAPCPPDGEVVRRDPYDKTVRLSR